MGKIEREHPFIMKYKYTPEETFPFKTIYLQQRLACGKPQCWPNILFHFYKSPPEIKAEKYNDLTTLLNYLPSIYMSFINIYRMKQRSQKTIWKI